MNLRVIFSIPMEGRINIGADIILARKLPRRGQSVLRFIRLLDSCVTIGRTVKDSQAFAAAICYPGANIYRRPTGGGIVFHGDQLSFSLIWPRDDVQILSGLSQSIAAINKAVHLGLAECGYSTRFATAEDADKSLLCSSSVTEGDLIADTGGKTFAGAQWRGDGFTLYQGHLWLRWAPILEESIAYSISNLLEAQAEVSGLTEQEKEEAVSESAKWQLEAKAA